MVALLFFVMCATVGSIILAAATASSGRLVNIRGDDQAYYATSSAAGLIIKQIEFLDVIKENIIEQGEINLERLGDGKPPFDRPGKFFSLFK